MRKIIVPPSVEVIDPITRERAHDKGSFLEPRDMHFFNVSFITSDPNMPEGWKGAEMVERLDELFLHCREGDEILVIEEDWDAALKVLEKPANKWIQSMAAQMTRFMRAWRTAEVVKKEDLPEGTR
jgi:hypothetical protein